MPRARGWPPTGARKGGCRDGPVAGRPPQDRRQAPPDHRRRRIPLKVITTEANVNDVTETLALVDGVPPVAGRVGHPRKRPDTLLGAKGYDSNPNRKELRRGGILPAISRKGQPDIQDLGRLRYVVEQTFALLHQFKRLTVHWELHPDLRDAFASLACSLICWRRLRKG
ncbi:transposase [Kitasatospora sp. NPDC017646]|uniref:transposase n=1 Tax=Kitasatospora sp. NPDC017646 TaxID=3364024 RepID=UPI00378F0296